MSFDMMLACTSPQTDGDADLEADKGHPKQQHSVPLKLHQNSPVPLALLRVESLAPHTGGVHFTKRADGSTPKLPPAWAVGGWGV